MGQKVNPHGIRVGVIKNWDAQWYADKKEFGAFLKEDYEIREYLKKTFPRSPIRKMERHGLKYEVELDNGVEIKFDKNLNVKEIDH